MVRRNFLSTVVTVWGCRRRLAGAQEDRTRRIAMRSSAPLSL
nr:hypothetical protein JVH1_8756 [Rhodococcus sp. JVH1]